MQLNLIIVFSRTPVLGKVKTRIAKDLGDLQALKIHKKLYNHTTAIVKEAKIPYKIYFSEDPIMDINHLFNVQTGIGLGDRMSNAFSSELIEYENICLIGSDCLELTANDIAKAFQHLAANDVVLGPAIDGGYYLIGLKKPHPQLFRNIHWGSSVVLEETLKTCSTHNLSVKLLRPLNDIDLLEDLPESWRLDN